MIQMYVLLYVFHSIYRIFVVKFSCHTAAATPPTCMKIQTFRGEKNCVLLFTREIHENITPQNFPVMFPFFK